MSARAWNIYGTDVAMAAKIAARVSYKPGWQFKHDGTGTILVMGEFKDITDPEKTICVAERVRVPMDMDENQVLHLVFWSIVRIENHESSEWFKVDGNAIFNEHVIHPERFGGVPK